MVCIARGRAGHERGTHYTELTHEPWGLERSTEGDPTPLQLGIGRVGPLIGYPAVIRVKKSHLDRQATVSGRHKGEFVVGTGGDNGVDRESHAVPFTRFGCRRRGRGDVERQRVSIGVAPTHEDGNPCGSTEANHRHGRRTRGHLPHPKSRNQTANPPREPGCRTLFRTPPADRLLSRLDAELADHGADVGLGGIEGDVQALGDLAVSQALGHQLEDFPLAGTEIDVAVLVVTTHAGRVGAPAGGLITLSKRLRSVVDRRPSVSGRVERKAGGNLF